MLRKKKYYKSGFTFIRTELIMYGNYKRSYCGGCIYKSNCYSLNKLNKVRYLCEILTPVGYQGRTRYIIKEYKEKIED